MTSCNRLSGIGLVAILFGLVFVVALPVWAEDTTIGLTVVVEPEAPYFGASADFTITVEASGGAVSGVATQIEHDCYEAIGPTELSGNGDDVLEPGEEWEYTCHTDSVFHGLVLVTVTGTDGVGGDVFESLMFDYGAPMPFAVEVATSTPEVYQGEEVIWAVLVGNDGPYAIINVDSDGRLNESGPYSFMTGPVEKSGNGDDLLDPGELWEYHWSAALWQDGFVSVSVSGAHVDAPGAGFSSHTVSDVVTVIPGQRPPEPEGAVVVYDPADGGVFFVDVNVFGDGFTTPWASGWIEDADAIGTAYLGGPFTTVDDVLFYSSVTGRFRFAYVTERDSSDQRSLLFIADVTGSKGWTHVETGDYNGDGTTDVLFYRATDGLMRFYTTTPTGRFIPITDAMYGNKGWTHLVVGDFDHDGSDDVLWYRARDGLMRFYEVTETGVFRAISPVYYGNWYWTTIPSGDYDGNGTDDLLFYRDDGLARFYEVDASGTFRALGAVFHPTPGYTQIEAVEFTPASPGVDLVWYHAAKDLLLATRYNTNGVVNLWAPQSTSGYGDNLLIAAGSFPQ